MRIALGTVQFGMKYGVANTSGQVHKEVVKDTLKLALKSGIDVLDTARAYGESEEILRYSGVENFKIVSKIPPVEEGNKNLVNMIKMSVTQSLTNLGCESLYGLLLHRPADLLRQNGLDIYASLLELKKQGIVEKIGISVYGPDDLDKLSDFQFDLVQAPMNILDRRMEKSGWLRRLSMQGTEIHIRSVFLQGLLLMKKSQRPKYFLPWQNLLSVYDNWIIENKLTPLQACLGFLNNYTEIDKVVVGVTSPKQLKEVISASSEASLSLPEKLRTNESALINPAEWLL